jgi:hypothetical protein
MRSRCWGKKVAAVDDFRIVRAVIGGVRHVVAQLVQSFHNDAKRFAAVVALEVFDVFQHENRRAARVKDPHHVEKQRPLGIAGKTVGAAEGVFLGNARQREGLAGKAGQQHVMLRHVLANMFGRLLVVDPRPVAERDIANILIKTVFRRIAVVVSLIGAHRMFIPFAGENALAADGFKSAPDPANTGEKIDKAKGIMGMMRRGDGQQTLQMRQLVLA